MTKRAQNLATLLIVLVIIGVAIFLTIPIGKFGITGLTFTDGNESNVTTTGVTTLAINIDNSAIDTNTNYTDNLSVEFFDGNNVLVNFTFDFEYDTLNLITVSIEKTTTGIAVTGISANKTVYIGKSNTNNVCVRDVDGATISSISNDCSGGDETLVTCDGSLQSGYTCSSYNSTHFNVTGLMNSAGESSEMTITAVTLDVLGQGAYTTLTVTGTNFENGSNVTFVDPDVNVLNSNFISSTQLTSLVYVSLNTTEGNAELFVNSSVGNTSYNITIVEGPLNTSSITVNYTPNYTGLPSSFNLSFTTSPGVNKSTLTFNNSYFEIRNSTFLAGNITLPNATDPPEYFYFTGEGVVGTSGYWDDNEFYTTVTVSTPPCAAGCEKEQESYYSYPVYFGALTCEFVEPCTDKEGIVGGSFLGFTLPVVGPGCSPAPTLCEKDPTDPDATPVTPEPVVSAIPGACDVAGGGTFTPPVGTTTITYHMEDGAFEDFIDCDYVISAAPTGGGGGGGGGKPQINLEVYKIVEVAEQIGGHQPNKIYRHYGAIQQFIDAVGNKLKNIIPPNVRAVWLHLQIKRPPGSLQRSEPIIWNWMGYNGVIQTDANGYAQIYMLREQLLSALDNGYDPAEIHTAPRNALEPPTIEWLKPGVVPPEEEAPTAAQIALPEGFCPTEIKCGGGVSTFNIPTIEEPYYPVDPEFSPEPEGPEEPTIAVDGNLVCKEISYTPADKGNTDVETVAENAWNTQSSFGQPFTGPAGEIIESSEALAAAIKSCVELPEEPPEPPPEPEPDCLFIQFPTIVCDKSGGESAVELWITNWWLPDPPCQPPGYSWMYGRWDCKAGRGKPQGLPDDFPTGTAPASGVQAGTFTLVDIANEYKNCCKIKCPEQKKTGSCGYNGGLGGYFQQQDTTYTSPSGGTMTPEALARCPKPKTENIPCDCNDVLKDQTCTEITMKAALGSRNNARMSADCCKKDEKCTPGTVLTCVPQEVLERSPYLVPGNDIVIVPETTLPTPSDTPTGGFITGMQALGGTTSNVPGVGQMTFVQIGTGYPTQFMQVGQVGAGAPGVSTGAGTAGALSTQYATMGSGYPTLFFSNFYTNIPQPATGGNIGLFGQPAGSGWPFLSPLPTIPTTVIAPGTPAPAGTTGGDIIRGVDPSCLGKETCLPDGTYSACVIPTDGTTREIADTESGDTIYDDDCNPWTPPPPVCGNGFVEGTETCESNSDCIGSQPMTCVGCQCVPGVPPVCGNGNLETGELCEQDSDCLAVLGAPGHCTNCACFPGPRGPTPTPPPGYQPPTTPTPPPYTPTLPTPPGVPTGPINPTAPTPTSPSAPTPGTPYTPTSPASPPIPPAIPGPIIGPITPTPPTQPGPITPTATPPAMPPGISPEGESVENSVGPGMCTYAEGKMRLERIEDVPRELIPSGTKLAFAAKAENQGDGVYDVTASISDRFDSKDTYILRCRMVDGEYECGSINGMIGTEASCGGQSYTRLLFDQMTARQQNIDVPSGFQPVTKTITSTQSISNGDYKVELLEGAGTFVLQMPTTLTQPVNPYSNILTAMELIMPAGKNKLEAQVTMPLPRPIPSNIDKYSLRLYAFAEGRWWELNSIPDIFAGKVSARINLRDYEENGKVIFAVMGVTCYACTESKFDMVYDGGGEKAVVLVHGLTSDGIGTWAPLIQEIKTAQLPVQVYIYSYPSWKTLEEVSLDLSSRLETLKDKYKIFPVGHSLGGLVVQQALQYSYIARQQDSSLFKYLDAVENGGVILLGAPNKGSPVGEVWKNLFAQLVAMKIPSTQFNPDSPLIKDAVNGREIPPVPGIRYYVLAGTKPLLFNLGFFTVSTEPLLNLYTPNDGMITTQSAYTLGEEAFNDPCDNYFEVNLDHLELNDHELARLIIQQLINRQFHDADPDKAYPGYSKYVNFKGDGWEVDDIYLIVGKELNEAQRPAVLDCACGNGVCGEGENVINCPTDCFSTGYNSFCIIAPTWT
ncbi:MAG TPA: alpha/beta hydrolase, partial [Candidatus Nanoarchaeia archaeon]|nr:alpha/beta hydrolase [Candidatus Nanoarchaeia archaeon]